MAATMAEIKKGDRVTVQGLEENKQFNGVQGTVKGKRKGRFEVLLDGVKINVLLKPEHIGAGTSLWMPVSKPSLQRQESFEQVQLVRQQSLEKRRRAKEFIKLLSKPFDTLEEGDELSSTAKFCLFLQEGKKDKGGEDLHLLSAFPSAVLKLSLKSIALIVDYSDFRIARLSVGKRGRDLFNFINVRRALSIKSGASLKQLTAEKLIAEKIRPKLRNSFGTLQKPDISEAETNNNEDEWEWNFDEYEDDEGEGGEEGYDPSDTTAKAKEVIPAGLSYLELGILLECLGGFYEEIAGAKWKEVDTGPEVVEANAASASAAPAPQSIAGKGYTGQQGETKEIARKIELKKLEDIVRDQVSGILFESICITLNDLLTGNKLDKPHVELLSQSCLNPLLGVYLRNTFMQIAERQELYLKILKAVEVLANEKHTVSMLFPSLSRHSDLFALLMTLKQQVHLFLASPNKGTDSDTVTLVQSAQEIERVLATVELQGKAYQKELRKQAAREGKQLTQKEREDLETKALMQRMKGLSVDFVDLLDAPKNTIWKHKFVLDAKKAPGSSQLSSRLTKEVGSMMSGLPPGIFVRVDKKRMDLMRVCIAGPEGSPYQNGMFMFDVYFPYNYPAVPPKMKIITTGRATFRFNANLYTNGKVCLSLLGTWQGPGWEPSYSNLQQVLISIQAMILGIDEPIANEPGWERDRGSEKSKRYNSILSHGTMLYAMYEHIATPPPGFEDVMKLHFWMKKDFLLENQLPKWEKAIEKAGPSEAGPYRQENRMPEKVGVTMKKLVKALKDLKPPAAAEKEEEDLDEDSDGSF